MAIMKPRSPPMDQKNNLATVSAFFDVWWMDEFLVWRPADYDGITKIFVPMKWVWKPEFYMYHSVYGRVPEYATDAPAQIQSDGRVRMFVSISSKSFCPINFKRFPFDSQTCSFSIAGLGAAAWELFSDVDAANRRRIVGAFDGDAGRVAQHRAALRVAARLVTEACLWVAGAHSHGQVDLTARLIAAKIPGRAVRLLTERPHVQLHLPVRVGTTSRQGDGWHVQDLAFTQGVVVQLEVGFDERVGGMR
ncbi:Neurotransmitter-gated ion-channel ligand binding domain protein [Ancylostoma duodenale]|uniref:Neurotransmitter-gated ion-channel ligand binding domain protein n=1 Tax=Ancylostoma duodenale TaxID=51022 RepID=A0A0C2DPZ1_9BILA|nr:Neurotransmitter-gated ion-channel ligand binding domain protein [Ancylostoma duodenale]